MSKHSGIELTRRKALAALGSVGAASAGAGLSTSAYFTDREVADNTVAAGELDLRIDWQQTYDGSDGLAFVNANPDHDGDGEQSLDTDQYDSVPDDGVVTYSGQDGDGPPAGANIQEYLTCETLENHTDANFNGQDNLIELEDVKPGDSGEVTFSLHLCDNPGYLWLTGGNFSASENGVTEPEADADAEDQQQGAGEPAPKAGESEPTAVELVDHLEVRAWYDLDCDNTFEDGERLIFARGTLDDLLGEGGRIAGDGVRLDRRVYDGFQTADSQTQQSQGECVRLGKLELEDQIAGDFDIAGGDGTELPEDGDDSSDDAESLNERYRLEDGDHHAVIDITDVDRKSSDDETDGEIIGIDFEIDEASPSDLGICRVDVKGGGGPNGSAQATNTYTFEGFCVDGVSDSGPDIKAPTVETGDGPKQTAISHLVFYYCPPTGETEDLQVPVPEPPCFEGDETYCIGVEWWLPADVGNEIQTDALGFDLGFYAEQCRHNAIPSGPPSGTNTQT